MNKTYLQAFGFILFVTLVAIAGVYAGQLCFSHGHKLHEYASSFPLDEYVHRNLSLSDQQKKELEPIEQRYYQRLKYLEEKLKLANMDLAQAIKENGRYTDSIEEAILANITNMGELQRLSIKHMFEMQTVLTHEQNAKMNHEIANALFNANP